MEREGLRHLPSSWTETMPFWSFWHMYVRGSFKNFAALATRDVCYILSLFDVASWDICTCSNVSPQHGFHCGKTCSWSSRHTCVFLSIPSAWKQVEVTLMNSVCDGTQLFVYCPCLLVKYFIITACIWWFSMLVSSACTVTGESQHTVRQKGIPNIAYQIMLHMFSGT